MKKPVSKSAGHKPMEKKPAKKAAPTKKSAASKAPAKKAAPAKKSTKAGGMMPMPKKRIY